MARKGFKGRVQIDFADGTSFTEVANVTEANVTLGNNTTEISEFDDTGIREIAGRYTANGDFTINYDDSEDTHQKDTGDGGLIDNIGNQVTIQYTPDRDNSNKAIRAHVILTDMDLPNDGTGANTSTVSFGNSDGNKWTLETAP